MSSELNLQLRFTYAKGNASLSRTLTKTLDVSGTAITHSVQNIGTTEETLVKNDVTLTGYAWFYNLDSTNYIEIGDNTGDYQIKLQAGYFAILPLDGATNIYAKAHTAACDLEYCLLPA